MGCYVLPQTAAANLTSELMTAQQCIEYCRGLNITHAAVQTAACYCYDDLLGFIQEVEIEDHCSEPCAGDSLQHCGQTGYVKLLNIGAFLIQT